MLGHASSIDQKMENEHMTTAKLLKPWGFVE